MSVTERTRKILWGRSGNRCAVCRVELVVAATPTDDDSVVGEECHIVSDSVNGPRYDESSPTTGVDQASNLILLCRTHHKMVDDQVETYTVDVLRTLKANHERWVAHSLTEKPEPSPVRVRRIEKNIPSHLIRLRSGRQIVNLIADACAYSFDHDEPRSEEEVSLVGGFCGEVQEWGESLDEVDAGARVQVGYELSRKIEELEARGFWVFGAREVQRIEGGVGGSSTWPVAILRILRSENPSILKVDLPEEDGDKVPASEGGAV